MFRIRCTIKKKVCDITIDSGSCENIISKSLIIIKKKTLELPTFKYPHPYKIGWIKKGIELAVNEVCIVSFSIGKFYQDEISRDVVDMKACHLLLGRPWQNDVDATHKGKDNVHTFQWKGKKRCFWFLQQIRQPNKLHLFLSYYQKLKHIWKLKMKWLFYWQKEIQNLWKMSQIKSNLRCNSLLICVMLSWQINYHP